MGAFRLNPDPPFLSPSPSFQRATCALHNRLSQNERRISAAERRMACLSRNEFWGYGSMVTKASCALSAFTMNSQPPTDR